MADMARIRETGAYHYATEIAFDETLQGLPWKCFGCETPVSPVAADGLTDYERAPHFRLLRGHQHHADCQGEGFRALGGQRARQDIGIPERLVLQGQRLPAAANVEHARAQNEVRDANDIQGQIIAGARVGALHPIVQYFSEEGADLDHLLRILDWPAQPFQAPCRTG